MKARKPPKFRLVYVQYEDHSGGDGWTPLDAAIRSNDEECFCHSVGWLVAENAERITIAASFGEASESNPQANVGGQMTIARSLIKHMQTVRIA